MLASSPPELKAFGRRFGVSGQKAASGPGNEQVPSLEGGWGLSFPGLRISEMPLMSERRTSSRRKLRHCASASFAALALGLFVSPALAQPSSTAAAEEEVAKPAIVPPKLVHFVEGVYPPEAFKQGLEATVVLKLLVQADGSVGSVEVIEPAGNGFDEAAVVAAREFVFTPAQKDGIPAPVFIKYAYRFEAKTVETPVQELPPPIAGNLEGSLLIAGPDVALGGAKVTVAGPDGVVRETTADEGGRWVFADLPPGKYRVRVSADGFESVDLNEEVVVGEASDVTYRVSPVSEGLEVVVTGERPPREVTRRTLQRREISRVPGTGGDALRSIQSLPGVARPPGLAGALIVRGSGPQDTNVFIDGALVPLVYHFGGLSSVVPTELLEKIDFYPGNFSSKYGRVSGGVVDVALRSPGTECTAEYGKATDEEGCFHGLAQLDLIDARFLLRGPIGEKTTFALAGRRSWVDTWLKPVLESADAGVTSAPVYYDYQAIVEHKPSKKTSIRAQFYGSDDVLEILLKNPSAEEPAFAGNVSFGTAFYRGQLTYESALSDKFDLTTTLAIGRDKIHFAIGPVLFDVDTYPIEYRSEFGWSVLPGFRLNAGIDFFAAPYHVRVRAPEPPRPGEPAPGKFSSRPILETDQRSTAFRPAWYLEGEVQPNERLQIVPGFRIDFARDSGHADYSPRINARYLLRGSASDVDAAGVTPRKTTLKAGAGVYDQPPTFQETDQVFGTPNIESNRSIHYTFGVEQELTDQLEVGLEGYYKDLNNLVSRAPGLAGSVYDNAGTGSVIGAETLIKYKADDRFFGWLAYSLSRSVRRNRPDQPEYPFQFDQTHILTVLGSYRLGDGWEMGARYRLVSGNNTTPVRRFPEVQALYDADAGSYVPLQGEPFSDRLPLFHQLDIRIEKNWQFRSWRLGAYLDVWNAYNNAAVEGIQYDFDYDQRSPQTGLPIIPSLGFRGEF